MYLIQFKYINNLLRLSIYDFDNILTLFYYIRI